MGAKNAKETLRQQQAASGSKPKTNPAELTEEEIELLLKNTHFNRKQIEEY
jgi:hypothetical protein